MEMGVIVLTPLAGSHRPRHVDSFSRLEKAGRWVLSWSLQKHSSVDTEPEAGHYPAALGGRAAGLPSPRAMPQSGQGQSWTGLCSPPDLRWAGRPRWAAGPSLGLRSRW